MKSIRRRLLSLVCAFALVANGIVGVMAQDKKNEYRADANNVLVGGGLTETVTITATDPNGLLQVIGLGDTNVLQFFAQELSFDSRLFSGSPFSAAVVSETMQTLADGTRIVQRAEGRLYRDNEGRTRNERSFAMSETSAPKQVTTIYDPVGSVSYTLDSETRSARKVELFRKAEPATPVVPSVATNVKATPKDSAIGELTAGPPSKRIQPSYPATAKAARAAGLVQVETIIGETGKIIDASVISGHPLLRDAALEAARGWLFEPTTLAGKPVKVRCLLQFDFRLIQEGRGPSQVANGNPKYTAHTEKLGKQMIEGVECEGERKVTTLLTGAIGNDRPIATVTETWYSPELRMMILSKRSDPRFGESTYRVANITRAEPEAALFQVPPDYTIKAAGK